MSNANARIIEIIKQVGIPLTDALRESLLSIITEEREKAKQYQFDCDVTMAVEMMCELKVPKEKMYDLLLEYWKIDKRSEAKGIIEYVSNVQYPIKKLKAYIFENCPNEDPQKFVVKYRVSRKLGSDPSLAKLPVDKLKKELEKE